MRLTAKSEYGLLAAIDLACRYGSGSVSARSISERRGIPPKFLEQILVSLRRAGIVTATRGARGGFALSADPSSITVLAIVEALEGALAPSVCNEGIGCDKSHLCAAVSVWSRAAVALREAFEGTTLAELAHTQAGFDGPLEDSGKGAA